MRTIHVRLLSLATFALLTVSANAAAQSKSPAILSGLEVQQLISRNATVDHARLAVHFKVLADNYTAEAKRHASMAQPVGNPGRNVTTTVSGHCKQLEELNTQSATAVRELAVHYQMLAAGQASVAPPDSAGFQAGAGARQPTDQELSGLAESAHTSAAHQELAAYFLALAKRYTTDVSNHTAFAKAYRGLPRGSNIAMAAHCDHVAALSHEAAKEASAAAAIHEDLAGAVR